MENRIDVTMHKLKFIFLDDLMDKAGKLDEELRFYKNSKSAKRLVLLEEKNEKPGKKKKGELRWKQPW